MEAKEPGIIIELHEGDGVGEILQICAMVQEQEIVLVFPRRFALLSDVGFLKRLIAGSQHGEKKLTFVVGQEMFHGMLEQLGCSVHKSLPHAVQEWPQKTLKQLYGKVAARKNVDFEKQEIREGAPPTTPKSPGFATQRIRNAVMGETLRGAWFFGGLGILGVLGVVWWWVSPSAVLVLKPKISPIPLTQNVVVMLPGAKIDKADENLPRVQAVLMEREVKDVVTFPTTGRNYELTNASGLVTLMNETGDEKFFVPSRLQTVDGVVVRTQEEVTVPPWTEKGGAGRITVRVVADEYDADGEPIGERGNVPAGTEFIFPALRKESQELYHAKANRGPLVGGSTLTRFYLKEEDFGLAEQQLVESFKIRGVEYLTQEIEKRGGREGKRFVLIEAPGLLKTELLDLTVPKERVGKEIQTFKMAGVVKVSGMVFDQTDVLVHLQRKLEETQDQRKELLSLDETSVEYRSLGKAEDLEEKGYVRLSVSVTGVETLDLGAENNFARKWRAQLRRAIAGKSADEARGILVNQPEIDDVLKIRLSPFWAESLPRIYNQIEFRIAQ